VNYPFTELNLPTIRVYIVRQGAVHQDSLFHLVYCNLFSVLLGLKLVFICAHPGFCPWSLTSGPRRTGEPGEGWGGYIL